MSENSSSMTPQESSASTNTAVSPSSYTTLGKRFPSDAVGEVMAAARNQVDQSLTLREHMSSQLKKGEYECLICTNPIETKHATWSCKTCYRCYHIGCTKKWASRAESGEGKNFRCPSCSTESTCPNAYRCFCGKVIDPKIDPFLPPHSCGDICGKARGNSCPHKCELPCHCGPCSTCKIMMPEKSCPCGKTTYSYHCGQPDPKKTCGNTCNKLLGCGLHQCSSECHHSSCPPCEERVQLTCHCGKESKTFPCGTTSFSCGKPCDKTTRCGNCQCDLTCHSGSCAPCKTDPSVVTTCPCGKTPLTSVVRTCCTDPIPTCGSRCGLPLACLLHECDELCHEGPCKRCTVKRQASCPCGSLTQKIRCFEAKDLNCHKQCGAQMSCLRHVCKEICCSHRRDPSTSAAIHQCKATCGRKLLCSHTCLEPCHSGSCPPCPHWILEDMVCGCGRQYLAAPQPCGTKLPPCNQACPKARVCEHELPHTCHYGPCPPCTVVVEKTCAGGHCFMKVACATDPATVSCGRTCGKELPFCGHPCNRKCHSGSCIPTTGVVASKKICTESCGIVLACGHNCQAKCHIQHRNLLKNKEQEQESSESSSASASASSSSKTTANNNESNIIIDPVIANCPSCSAIVEVACKCGVQSVKFSCKEFMKWKQDHPSATTVPCLEDCDHKRRLSALRPAGSSSLLSSSSSSSPLTLNATGGFSSSSGSSDMFNTPTVFPVRLFNACQGSPGVDFFCSLEEGFLQVMKSKEGFFKFNPANTERRRLTHEYAWMFNISTKSVDIEPKRAVLAERTPDSKLPPIILSKAIYDDKKHSPLNILKSALQNHSTAKKHVVVFEGDRLTEADVHAPLRPFGGKVVFISSVDELRYIPQIAPDASQKLRRGDINVVLCVFPTPSICTNALSYLRKSQCKLNFHGFSDVPPPRQVPDSMGRLVLQKQEAVAFITEDDTLWTSSSSSSSASASAAVSGTTSLFTTSSASSSVSKSNKKTYSSPASLDFTNVLGGNSQQQQQQKTTSSKPPTITPLDKPRTTTSPTSSAPTQKSVWGSPSVGAGTGTSAPPTWAESMKKNKS